MFWFFENSVVSIWVNAVHFLLIFLLFFISSCGGCYLLLSHLWVLPPCDFCMVLVCGNLDKGKFVYGSWIKIPSMRSLIIQFHWLSQELCFPLANSDFGSPISHLWMVYMHGYMHACKCVGNTTELAFHFFTASVLFFFFFW